MPIELIVDVKKLLYHRLPNYKRTSQLIKIAYYYLLRVGGQTKLKRRTRTLQFRIQDLLFWNNLKALSPIRDKDTGLLGIEAGTMRISN